MTFRLASARIGSLRLFVVHGELVELPAHFGEKLSQILLDSRHWAATGTCLLAVRGLDETCCGESASSINNIAIQSLGEDLHGSAMRPISVLKVSGPMNVDTEHDAYKCLLAYLKVVSQGKSKHNTQLDTSTQTHDMD